MVFCVGHHNAIHDVDPRDPRSSIERVLERINAAADSDLSLFYTVAEVRDSPRVDDFFLVGDTPLRARVRELFSAPSGWISPFLQYRRPSPRETRDFLESSALFGRGVLQNTPFWKTNFAPWGACDQARLLVMHGTVFVGLVAAVRTDPERPFTRRDRRRLASLVAPVVSTLSTAVALDRKGLAEASLVLEPCGSVEFVSPDAAPWLHRREFAEQLAAAVRAFDRGTLEEPVCAFAGGEVHLTRLEAPGQTRYLARVAPTALPKLSAVGRLSPTQRGVAEDAAAGATVAEIARARGLGVETIRTHLREVYARLNVSSRAELVLLLAQNGAAHTAR